MLVVVYYAPDCKLCDNIEFAKKVEAVEALFDKPLLVVLTGDPIVCVAFVDWVEELVDVKVWDVGAVGVVVEVEDKVVVLDDDIVF